jgi:hypothetical protein
MAKVASSGAARLYAVGPPFEVSERLQDPWLYRSAKKRKPFIAGQPNPRSFLVYNFVVEPLLEPLKRDQRGAAILPEMGLAERR